MRINQNHIIDNIKNKEKEVSDLYYLYAKTASDFLISNMLNDGPQLLKDLINRRDDSSIRIDKVYDYDYGQSGGDWAIFFVLDIGSNGLNFMTEDIIGGFGYLKLTF